MSGYIKVQITGDGQTIVCWQDIQNGEVIGYRNVNGDSILVPVMREEVVIDPTFQSAIF